MLKKNKKALVVLSGGQDSTTCLFLAKQAYEEVHAITFNYGQRHELELTAAEKVGKLAGVVTHEFIDVSGILKSTSPLVSNNPLEKYESFEQMDAIIGDRVELTFVPMRNSLFFTIAANRAIALDCTTIVTGICQEDNANYPDCTEGFRSATEDFINLSIGNKFGYYEGWPLTLEAPLISVSKAESVLKAFKTPGCWKALAYTHTSYDGVYPPTDKNHSNVLRAHGFEKAMLPDPLVVRAWCEGLMALPETINYLDQIKLDYIMNLLDKDDA